MPIHTTGSAVKNLDRLCYETQKTKMLVVLVFNIKSPIVLTVYFQPIRFEYFETILQNKNSILCRITKKIKKFFQCPIIITSTLFFVS